jgi:hypothetical protein
MYENKWSPFDPEWYQKAFDQNISTADQLFNRNTLISEGYEIPDYDGTRSSAFRKDAITTNTFSQDKVVETLKDIYLNSSHKLKANNHDNTHFFQWNCTMKDVDIDISSNTCSIIIPTENFISSDMRDKFKLSQYFRKWIKVEDMLNNWDKFKWFCMMFVNQRVYSEYEIRIDDKEVTIRWNYNTYWKKANFPIYIYKFDTNASCRVFISRYQCEEIWGWKLPVSYLTNDHIRNSSKVVITVNKVSNDSGYRTDDVTSVDVLGDNMEFLPIEDGYIDLSEMSEYNRNLILSETTSEQNLWLSVFVPKFLHEFPILLPTDVINRPYLADFQKVVTINHEISKEVYGKFRSSGANRNIYVDMNNGMKESHDETKEMIRPVVLSDAFEYERDDADNEYISYIDKLRNLIVIGADTIEDFRFDIKVNNNDEVLNTWLEKLKTDLGNIYSAYNQFLDVLEIDHNDEYDTKYEEFLETVKEIKKDGIYSEWLDDQDTPNRDESLTLWFYLSPLIYIPQQIVDKYYVSIILSGMKKKDLWESGLEGTIRFQRPIDTTDFWTFEYDSNNEVWRPYILNVEHHFPDVYLLSETDDSTSISNRIFKAFFFYTDTINVNKETIPITRATASWDDDMNQFEYEKEGTFREIFMEKFYWMGIQSIYKGLTTTNYRYEAIEHVIDNPSYQRFNDLFLNTMDPYYKLGLATYLKNSNNEFPFDDAIDKMKEAINLNWLGYQKVTNFEQYLNKQWTPSYFDYIAKITDNYDFSSHTARRPRESFDTDKFLPTISGVELEVDNVIQNVYHDLVNVIDVLERNDYQLNTDNVIEIKDQLFEMQSLLGTIIKTIYDLDTNTFTIDQINDITAMMNKYNELFASIKSVIAEVYNDNNNHKVYEDKLEEYQEAVFISDGFEKQINAVFEKSYSVDMNKFMDTINNLKTLMIFQKENPDDTSLIYDINQFEYPWSDEVKTARNLLFQSTSKLFGTFVPNISYSDEMIGNIMEYINTSDNDIHNLKLVLIDYWKNFGYDQDDAILDKLSYCDEVLESMITDISTYLVYRDTFVQSLNNLYAIIDSDKLPWTESEQKVFDTIKLYGDSIKSFLSYLSGSNDDNQTLALNSLSDLKNQLDTWKILLDEEENTFNTLDSVVNPEKDILGKLDEYSELFNAIIEYLNTIDTEYIPDSDQPTYSDVYKIDTIELVTGGFDHDINDIIYVKNIGVYKITEVEGNINKAKSIEFIDDIATSFRNPLWQNNLYDSISDGPGLGITIKPLTVTHEKIMNDHAVDRYVMKITNIILSIETNIETYDPKLNIDLQDDIDDAKESYQEWSSLIKKYGSYISTNLLEYIEETYDKLIDLCSQMKEYIDCRENIDVSGLLSDTETLLNESYTYIAENNLDDEAYINYYELVKESCTNLSNFLIDNSAWDDSKSIRYLADALSMSVNVYKNKILNNIEDESITFSETASNVIKQVTIIDSAIDDLPLYRIDIDPLIKAIDNRINDIPYDYISDTWYRIESSAASIGGTGYSIGDIVELVSDKFEDKFYFLVSSIEKGVVTSVTPLLQYAIKYDITGLYETKKDVGIGSGLCILISSKQVDITDNTILYDDTSDKTNANQFNDTDNLVYQFENTHDLDIQYEVFLAGKQITDFNVVTDGSIDSIYVNANSVADLQNSSLFEPAEQYYVYRIEDIKVVDPGAGYTVGQEVYTDCENTTLHMFVSELTNDPYKGISQVELESGLTFKDLDPGNPNAEVVTDTFNNIDDEFNSSEYNSTFMFGDVDINDVEEAPQNGDQDYHWYQGTRYDDTKRWNGIQTTVPPTDPFIEDPEIVPMNQPFKGEYQLIQQVRIHNSKNINNTNITEWPETSVLNAAQVKADFTCASYEDLPRYYSQFKNVSVGKNVIVESDETHQGHRMLYKVRSFAVTGYIIYELPEYADYKWNKFVVNWLSDDWISDYPSLKSQYPTAPWNTAVTFNEVQHEITDEKHQVAYEGLEYGTNTYIDDITIDDISVFNWTTKDWEDLSDTDKWKLEVTKDEKNHKYGFTLSYIGKGKYTYDMALYLNKTVATQIKNEKLKRNAVLNIETTVYDYVNKAAKNTIVNTGRHLRIRKLFPFYFEQSFKIGYPNEDDSTLGYIMNVKIPEYQYYKNEIHLEDIKIYNETAGRFEDILDRSKFEVRFKDDKSKGHGWETQTTIVQSVIGTSGSGFNNGDVWAYNATYDVHVFGYVTSDFLEDGHILTFTPIHTINAPNENMSMEFTVFQNDDQTMNQSATILIEFETKKVEVFGDGYIHEVSNRMAIIPNEFQVIVQYDVADTADYKVIIDKTPQKWTFIRPDSESYITFHLDNVSIQTDRLYVLTDKGRFPLINPSTNKPTLYAEINGDGTDVTFLNTYVAYEHLMICSTPYPMRSVYTLRTIPESGYIDLGGRLNKPLDKKHFEFWVNGKLLNDEVTIISPTKFFMHGLTSLKNLEIIEINRDSNEYFADDFIYVESNEINRSYVRWNYRTYLDDVLEAVLDGDNYSDTEQEYLLTPVWQQVDEDNKDFKNYPPNVDTDDDILVRTSSTGSLSNQNYQYTVSDLPTLEGKAILDQTMDFEDFGLAPISDEMIVNMLNSEWADEIKSGQVSTHVIISANEYYGMAARLYDEYGNQVHDLELAAYMVADNHILQINSKTKKSSIIEIQQEYDLD